MEKIIGRNGNYEIHFDKQNVIVYSLVYVSNEPTGWRKELKSDMQKALKQLHAKDGEGIVAVYGSVNKGKPKSDTENVLFYNLRAGSFEGIASCGISFDTLSQQKTIDQLAKDGKSEYQHYYSYQIEEIGPTPNREAKWLLRWDKIALPFLSGEVVDFWKLIREHIGDIDVHGDFVDKVYDGCFGIDIQIFEKETKPEKPTNLARLVKKLLDGVICAFHKMQSNADEVSLAAALSRPGLQTEQQLSEAKTILGERKYVRAIWDPKDDCCTAANITIEYKAKERCFSGTIYRKDD